MPDQVKRTAYYQGKVEAVRTAQERSAVDGSLDARNTVLTLVGLVGWYFAAPQISRMVMDEDPFDPTVLASHRAALVEAARRIVTPPPHR